MELEYIRYLILLSIQRSQKSQDVRIVLQTAPTPPQSTGLTLAQPWRYKRGLVSNQRRGNSFAVVSNLRIFPFFSSDWLLDYVCDVTVKLGSGLQMEEALSLFRASQQRIACFRVASLIYTRLRPQWSDLLFNTLWGHRIHIASFLN